MARRQQCGDLRVHVGFASDSVRGLGLVFTVTLKSSPLAEVGEFSIQEMWALCHAGPGAKDPVKQAPTESLKCWFLSMEKFFWLDRNTDGNVGAASCDGFQVVKQIRMVEKLKERAIV